MLERLAAGAATPERLACRRAERGDALRVRAVAARAGQRLDTRTRHEAQRRDGRQRHWPRRGDAVLAEFAPPGFAHPVGGPGRRTAHLDAHRAETFSLERRDDALLDDLGRRAAG